MLREGWTYAAAGEAAGVSRRTVGKWVHPFRAAGGPRGLRVRPGAPAHQTPAATVALIRQLRETHGRPASALGRALGVPRVDGVSAWLRRLGLSRRPCPPPVPVQPYEWPAAGDLLHLDIKPLGRFRRAGHRVHGDRRQGSPGVGWEYAQVAIDDHTRLADVEVRADQRSPACAAFLQRALAWYRARGVVCQRVLTRRRQWLRVAAFRQSVPGRPLRHLRTLPRTPRTNGKAERFVQTLLREWAYARPYATSQERRRGAATLGAVLQSRAPPRESRLSAAAHPAAESCLMNNVFDLNS